MVGLEFLAVFVRDDMPSLSPLFILAVLRGLEVLLLVVCGPKSSPVPLARIMRETLVLASFLIAAGTLVLFLWKAIVGWPLIETVRDMPRLSGFALLTFYLTACVLSPIAEEFVFRRLIYRSGRAYWNALVCTAMVSLLFGLLHQHFNAQFLVPFLGSVIFCLAYEKIKSIITPILLHMIGNMTIYLASLPALT
ncbi:MAG: CPBP family intramembrane metalloprotease [Deltaproteobacteria bacterium]|nr:CPBP family intramembrane metalloprotease [Deltaproteobacteria bacterium]